MLDRMTKYFSEVYQPLHCKNKKKFVNKQEMRSFGKENSVGRIICSIPLLLIE